MKVLHYLLILIIFLFGVSFAWQNASLVTIHFYVTEKQLALSLLLGISFGFGILVGVLFFFSVYLRCMRDNFVLKRQVQLAEKEMSHLRATSLTEES